MRVQSWRRCPHLYRSMLPRSRKTLVDPRRSLTRWIFVGMVASMVMLGVMSWRWLLFDEYVFSSGTSHHHAESLALFMNQRENVNDQSDLSQNGLLKVRESAAARRARHRSEQKGTSASKQQFPAKSIQQNADNQHRSIILRNFTHASSTLRRLKTPPPIYKPVPSTVEDDPLRTSQTWKHASKTLPLRPAVPYLGVLLDAGRHYFSVDWIKRMIDRIADMNYNLIHFRLTDDQTFNVLLQSYPELAYPSTGHTRVYLPSELRQITQYAKEKGIRIMPEINVPGHAGAWAGIPDMIVKCPEFVCSKGYGLPLNITHHRLRPILTGILTEIIDIFDNPPFLHLGGDEVDMSLPCFREARLPMFHYQDFEDNLRQILQDIPYPEKQVVRWEQSKLSSIARTMGIQQWWLNHPGQGSSRTSPGNKWLEEGRQPYFISTWLYFDTNGDEDAFDVYKKARLKFDVKGAEPMGIIAGCFELSEEFWFDRNILGRLLAVAMGASNKIFTRSSIQNTGEERPTAAPTVESKAVARVSRKVASTEMKTINQQWYDFCDNLGFGDVICANYGRPVILTRDYIAKWKVGWSNWKQDICRRITIEGEKRIFTIPPSSTSSMEVQGSQYFWSSFPLLGSPSDAVSLPLPANTSLPSDLSLLLQHTVLRSGLIFDPTLESTDMSRLVQILEKEMAPLGFSAAQIKLVTNHGFVFTPRLFPVLHHALPSANSRFRGADLKYLSDKAAKLGIETIPEVAVSTDAGGWFKSGKIATCAEHMCKGNGVPLDVENNFLQILYPVISELRQSFTSPFFHLGSDNRVATKACFEEVEYENNFTHFETRLESLLGLIGLTSAKTVRHASTEGTEYPDRFGSVTQHRPNQIPNLNNGDLIFLTVDLFEGDGFRIFQASKRAASNKPHAIFANVVKLSAIDWQKFEISKRLLAFAMGISKVASDDDGASLSDVSSFAIRFQSICQSLSRLHPGWSTGSSDCSAPRTLSEPVTTVLDSANFLESHCKAHTRLTTVHTFRQPAPWHSKSNTSLL